MTEIKNQKSKIKNQKSDNSALRTPDSALIRVPASTSNLGAGFDCFGLALKLYLNVEARVDVESQMPCRVEVIFEESHSHFPRDENNLIYRAMKITAEKFNKSLPSVHLKIHNEIPLCSGLGSSAAAIVAGIELANRLCELNLSKDEMLQIATEMEGHPDNVAASIFGGWVINCVDEEGKTITIKRDFPDEIKIIAVTPHAQLETKKAREVLPKTVSHKDAVFNLQRASLFIAAIESRSFDLLREAMRDCLHQPYRQDLILGLKDALAIDGIEGLLGVCLSGAGPSVLAFATENFDAISEAIADCFQQNDIETTVRFLEVCNAGISFEESL
jgi:homoserine kinase